MSNPLSISTCLNEAYRRYVDFHYGKSLETAWTGLGTFTDYKRAFESGYMTYATAPNPRYVTWWRLTPKGAKIIQEWIDRDKTVIRY